MNNRNIFIVGANGQLGTALRAQYPGSRFADIDQLDITSQDSVVNFDWSGITTIINAAAYTNVDGAETNEGRAAAWKVNAIAVAYLAQVCLIHDITLIHISSDYVFDGSQSPHREDEPFSPLSVYGQSKAAGDLVVSLLPKHYILRATWVIGEGKNFVRTMLSLVERGIEPTVVADQIGRLTFTNELVRAADYLLTQSAAFGTYNVTNDGESMSWSDITRQIFALAGYDNVTVTDISTIEYYAGKTGIAPRPLLSTMSLEKLHSTGFSSRNWLDDLKDYIEREK